MPGFPPFVGPARQFLGVPPGAETVPTVTSVSPNHDRTVGGAAVTITGANFATNADGAAPIVTFDGVAATSVVVVSSTSITCVTPAVPDTGAIDIVVWRGSQFGTLYAAFTVVAGVIESVSPPSGPYSGGTSVAISGFNFVTGSTVLFGSTAVDPGDVSFIDSQHISVVTPNQAVGFADVVIVEPGGAILRLRNGFQFTLFTLTSDIRRQPGITIHDVLGNTANTCSFRVDGRARVPIVGEKTEIRDAFDNDRLLFAGTVQSIEQIYEGKATQLAWNLQAIDFTWLMNRRRPFGLYVNTSVSDIVKDLIANYAPGFTTTKVQTNLAKVTILLDGTRDLVTVLTELATAIGGGHWKVDYTQDLHFFHVVSPGLSASIPFAPPVTAPPSSMPDLTSFITVAEGSAIPAIFTFPAGYYTLSYSNLYSDGTESALQSISNCVYLTGTKVWNISNVPVGADPGAITCVARRIYYNEFIKGGTPIENVKEFCQINDNTTTAFTTWFGITGASTSAISAIGAFRSYTTPEGVGVPGTAVQLSVQAAMVIYNRQINTGWATAQCNSVGDGNTLLIYKGASVLPFTTTPFYSIGALPGTFGSGNVVWYMCAYPGSLTPATRAAQLENMVDAAATVPPKRAFTGHPIGPAAAPTLTIDPITGPQYWDGGSVQAKVACLYRDGSVSYPSPASGTVVKALVQGEGIKGFSLSNIPAGPVIGGLDIVARFVYFSRNITVNPAFSVEFGPTGPPAGYVWPIEFADPNWTPSQTVGIIVINDNTTTTLGPFSLTDLNGPAASLGLDAGILVGKGNLPYDNASVVELSSDPIPVWPNPDGPSLEDDDPPDDIDDTTRLLTDAAGQQFTASTDVSQIRNRIFVIGAGSTVVQTARAGDTVLRFADVSTYSPAGGVVKIEDQSSGVSLLVSYTGVTGVPGQTYLVLAAPLSQNVSQGAVVNNFYQADDLDSQKFMSNIELDVNGARTDGIHEYTVTDGSLKSVFQLYMRAYAELELFAKPIVNIRYSTRDSKTKAGQTIHVDLTNPPCQGDFLIQEVEIDQIHVDSDTIFPRYTVRASSTRFELNDLLLSIISSINTPSQSGLVQSAISQSSRGSGTVLPARKWYSSILSRTNFGTASLPGYVNLNGTNVTAASGGGVGNQVIGVTDDEGYWERVTAGDASGGSSDARINNFSAVPFAYSTHNPIAACRIRTDPITLTAHRLFVVLSDISHPNGPNNREDNGGIGGGWIGAGVAIFLGTGANWVAFMSDGAGAYRVGATICAAQFSTIYDITLTLNATTLTADINGISVTMPGLPVALRTTGLCYVMRGFVDTTAANLSVRSFDWNAQYFETD